MSYRDYIGLHQSNRNFASRNLAFLFCQNSYTQISEPKMFQYHMSSALPALHPETLAMPYAHLVSPLFQHQLPTHPQSENSILDPILMLRTQSCNPQPHSIHAPLSPLPHPPPFHQSPQSPLLQSNHAAYSSTPHLFPSMRAVRT